MQTYSRSGFSPSHALLNNKDLAARFFTANFFFFFFSFWLLESELNPNSALLRMYWVCSRKSRSGKRKKPRETRTKLWPYQSKGQSRNFTRTRNSGDAQGLDGTKAARGSYSEATLMHSSMESWTYLGQETPLIPSNPTKKPALPNHIPKCPIHRGLHLCPGQMCQHFP